MPSKPEQFASYVVQKLQDAGFQAFWAGGCVRDRLLGRQPTDYDVATDATPKQIRRVFRRHRTLNIGAAFGVVAIIGSTGEGTVEVATFRRDATYSDGRHPDHVTFSSPQEDAQRRDFTINGMFYDPSRHRVIDFVHGQKDLQSRIIRAIGDPHARIEEDKLRMLRAVRFAAHYQFTLEEQTKRAISGRPAAIAVVSAERIADELRKMLSHPSRAESVRLLRETGLLSAVLPESAWFSSPEGEKAWSETLLVLDALEDAGFPIALAALLRRLPLASSGTGASVPSICARWKLANRETELAVWLLEHEPTVRSAKTVAWSKLQPILVDDAAQFMMGFASAVAKVVDGSLEHVEYCQQRLELPPQQLNPDPLITGDDLIAHGLVPGRQFKAILDAVREAQLGGQISSKEEALALADRLYQPTDERRH